MDWSDEIGRVEVGSKPNGCRVGTRPSHGFEGTDLSKPRLAGIPHLRSEMPFTIHWSEPERSCHGI